METDDGDRGGMLDGGGVYVYEIVGPVAVPFSRSGRLLMSMMCWPS